MSEEISMFELLNERMEKEDIVKLVCNYDNKFNKLEEENKRLNNIINELESWLAKEYISGNYEELYRIGLQDSYDKLQELKGSDK